MAHSREEISWRRSLHCVWEPAPKQTIDTINVTWNETKAFSLTAANGVMFVAPLYKVLAHIQKLHLHKGVEVSSFWSRCDTNS